MGQQCVDPVPPLELLEMDIKYVWVEEHARHVFVLTVIDTFTRFLLPKHVAYRMTRYEVIAVWEYVIAHYLQEFDALVKGLHIEVRNDNGPQFGAKDVQKLFEDNHLHRFHFQTLEELESNIDGFYAKYNCVRLHGSIASLTPMLFWNYWDEGLITRIERESKCATFKLNIP